MSNQLRSESHQKVHQKTRDYLYSLFGEVNINAVESAFTLQEGSTFVNVRTFSIEATAAAVEIFAYVVVDLEVTEALLKELLTYNLKLVLGAFGLAIGADGKGSVLLTYTMLGDSMQQNDLYSAISAIARVADDLDDKLVDRFGGKTALGKLMETPIPERWE